MNQLHRGSFRLFQLAGITVYLHWSWFLVAYIEIYQRQSAYSAVWWNLVEYICLFGIVLLHEFGHALACRSVGGVAKQIVLWPLGGIAFVSPPPRPGAVLWSIAAGPLVNLLLVPITFGVRQLGTALGWQETHADLFHFLNMILWINLGLLIFNMLPIYPLDGGQILQALLWFLVGRAQSLMIASVLGLVFGVLVLGLVGLSAVLSQALGLGLDGGLIWLGVIGIFIIFRSWVGFQQSRALAAYLAAPRREDAACPACGAAPIIGPHWGCDLCHERFDTFAHRAVCPRCAKNFPKTMCLECRQSSPLAAWFRAEPLAEPQQTGDGDPKVSESEEFL
jgi:Zn-dependent protease